MQWKGGAFSGSARASGSMRILLRIPSMRSIIFLIVGLGMKGVFRAA
jgi:hypothetical protein